MWTINGRSYFTKRLNSMDKVLLSGFAVVVVGLVIQVVLNLTGIDLPTDWLSDGEITLGELLRFIGEILIYITSAVGVAISASSRTVRKMFKK